MLNNFKDLKIWHKRIDLVSASPGFTLMELLIYVGIFAIAAGLLTGVLFTVLRVQQRESSSVEVTQQMNFVMQTIQRLVKESSVIIVNSTLADVDNDATIGTSQARLVLRMKDSGGNPIADRDPIIIWRDTATNVIKISEGLNQRISDLTNSRVIADKIEFTKLVQYPGHDTVSVDMQLTYNSNNPQEKISRSLRSAIARVSAATFDSDLLPGGTYNYNLGQSGSPWKTLYMSDGSVSNPSYTFSNDTTLGLFKVAGTSTIGFSTQGLERMRINTKGYVGIGTITPTYPLDMRYEFTKTDTAWRNVFRLGSNDAANPLTLQFAMLGAATQSDRKAMIQVAEEGVANAGTLSLQPNGGNVGIGTTAPVNKLDVAGEVQFYRAGAISAGLYFGLNMANGIAAIVSSDQNNVTNDLQLQGKTISLNTQEGTSRLFMNSSGNVGIGTTGPGTKVHITSIINLDGVKISQTGNGIADFKIGLTNNDDALSRGVVKFQSSIDGGALADRITINAVGNVGIGTATPAVKLVVTQTAASEGVYFYAPVGAGNLSILSLYTNDNDRKFYFNNAGGGQADGSFGGGGADYAEYFENLNKEIIEKGTIVALEKGKLRVARKEDIFIIGAVSTFPGITGNNGNTEEERYKYPKRWTLVTLLGQIPLKVRGNIKHGDYIELFNEGVGQKSEQWHPSVIGRAMEDYNSENVGKINVLVK